MPTGKKIKPTDADRKQVSALTAYGIPQDAIADLMGIQRVALARHYKRELALAAHQANARVAESLYQLAIKGNLGAMTFWLKTRAHWRETDRLEITDPEGKPLGSGAVATLMDRLESIAGRKAAALASNGHELPEGTDE